MSKLIESSEFGDWLLREISQTDAQSRCVKTQGAVEERLRLQTLKTAKKMLLEYLKIQHSMLAAASVARHSRS